MKIVQFTNKKFAVRRRRLFYQYLGEDGFWWSSMEYVIKYCLLESAHEARRRAQKFDMKIIWKGSIR